MALNHSSTCPKGCNGLKGKDLGEEAGDGRRRGAACQDLRALMWKGKVVACAGPDR